MYSNGVIVVQGIASDGKCFGYADYVGFQNAKYAFKALHNKVPEYSKSNYKFYLYHYEYGTDLNPVPRLVKEDKEFAYVDGKSQRTNCTSPIPEVLY